MDGENELYYRFTAWIKIVVKRAKIDFIRREKKTFSEYSLEDESITKKLKYEPVLESEQKANEFNFENKDLAKIFSKLTPTRKKILLYLFVKNLSPEEIANELGCSIQNVYNQRSLALKELKKHLNKEG